MYAKTDFQLGVYHQTVEEYDIAETFLKGAIETQKLSLDENHTDIANSYPNLKIYAKL